MDSEKFPSTVEELLSLALFHWRLQNKAAARLRYDQAVARMEQHGHADEKLCRLRAHVAATLGLEEGTS